MHIALTSLLLGNAGITTLVEDRIVWKKMEPTAALPRIVLHTIARQTDYNMDGPSGLRSTQVQVDCLGSTYAEALAVANAVSSCLSGYKGTVGTTKFDGVFQDAMRDSIEDDDTPSDLFGVSLDFTLWHKET